MPPTREFVEFRDPHNSNLSWSVDVTFLTSRWQCIFGCGCQGVYDEGTGKSSNDGGCCTLGAFLEDDKEIKRIRKLVPQLSAQDWQLRDEGTKRGFLVKGDSENGPARTRVFKGACIFANREGFEGGIGCAFHHYALRTGQHPSDVKPHVCWMLPLRDDVLEFDDDGNPKRMILTEYAEQDWGEGVKFEWYCISRPEAFANPAGMVFRTQEVELRKMVGDRLYEEIATYIEARLPKSPKKLLPFIQHPTEAARNGNGQANGSKAKKKD